MPNINVEISIGLLKAMRHYCVESGLSQKAFVTFALEEAVNYGDEQGAAGVGATVAGVKKARRRTSGTKPAVDVKNGDPDTFDGGANDVSRPRVEAGSKASGEPHRDGKVGDKRCLHGFITCAACGFKNGVKLK